MKKQILYILCILGITTSIHQVSAQDLNSSYFMEGMYHKHEINPAFGAERHYVTMPVISNLGISAKANIGLENFLFKYNKNGYPLTTFMNPDISKEAFLSKLNQNNQLGVTLSLPIIGFGFRGIGGYNTFDIKICSETNANLPYELFDFMKSGMTDVNGTKYSFNNLNVQSNNYVEIALGHSHALLNEQLRIGAKVKILIGAANISTQIDQMDLYMSENQWIINAQGNLKGSIKGAYLKNKDGERIPNNSRQEINSMGIGTPGIGGFGFAADLGIIYDMKNWVKGLKISASILDLGFIKWNETICGAIDPVEYTFKGFKNPIDINANTGETGNINHELDVITDDLKEMFKFKEQGSGAGRTTSLAATFNLGAEYAMPFYDRLKFGLLYSSHFNKPFTWHEGRLSANIAPIHWFEASVSYGFGSLGNSLGAVINFHPKGFNFFVGTDHVITKVNPQFIPLKKATVDVFLGINFTFGKRQ